MFQIIAFQHFSRLLGFIEAAMVSILIIWSRYFWEIDTEDRTQSFRVENDTDYIKESQSADNVR